MADPNIELLTLVAEALGDLRERLVFVGGCATALLITDEAAAPVRATEDVDAIIAVVSLPEYRKLGEALRSRGFSQTLAQSDPPFRWTFAGLKLDVMPIDPAVLGFSNRWYEFAMQRLPGTALGTIPVRRLFTTMGTRTEPLTYWFPVGDKAVQGTTQKKACGPALRPDRTYSKWYALSCFFDRPGRGSSGR